jgi:hypothetical protein
VNRNTEQLNQAISIFISRNEELQRYLDNFHVHPGGINIQARREDYAKAAFATAAEERGTTVEDYALAHIARSPAELESLRVERRKDLAKAQTQQDMIPG